MDYNKLTKNIGGNECKTNATAVIAIAIDCSTIIATTFSIEQLRKATSLRITTQ